MSYRDRAKSLSFEVEQIDAAIAAGIVGAIQSGNLLQLWYIESIRFFARAVGRNDLTTGWVVLLVSGVVFSLLFAGIVSNFVQEFVTKTMMLSRKSDILRKVLVPMLNLTALGITLSGLGIAYGIVLGIVFYGLALPAWIHLVFGGGMPFPYLDIVPIILWANYGALLGLVYGFLLEN